MEQWFRPMGLNLRVLTDTSKLTTAVYRAYGLFGAGDATAAVDLQFDFTQSANYLTARREYRMSPHGAELIVGGQVVLSIDLAGTARGCFPEHFIDDCRSFRLHALHFALSAALSARGFLGVHAACISIDGDAVLLRGPHGAGKTVLAYFAASRGFQVITGSTVWITPDDNTWWGIPRWIYLRPSARNLFPEITASPDVVLGDELKIEVDLTQSFAGSTVPFIRPGIIVYVERNPQKAACLETIQHSQALSLWKGGEAGNEASAVGYETRVAYLLRGRSYRLNTSDQINHVLDLIVAAAQDQAAC